MSEQSIDRFLEACGGTGPLYLNIEYQGKQEPMPRVLQQPFALIGRDAHADLFLSHDQVSRCHTYLQLVGGRLFCVDLHSRTGTHWERGPKSYGWLDYQRAIRIGPFWIRLVNGGRDGQAAPPSQRSASDFLAQHGLPEVTLEIAAGSGDSWNWQMTPTVALVGRSDDCRVCLRDRSVSWFHCSLVRTPLGVWVIDLLGRGGIAVNEVFVRCTRLEDGDRLQVGKFLIHLHYETAPISRIRRNQVPQSDVPTPPSQVGSISETQLAANSFSAQTTVAPDSATPSGEPPRSPRGDLILVGAESSLPSVERTEDFLVPVARQMALMQQQMFDQFQQGMMMMFQMFHTLHKDQLGIIREELDQLHKLTQEVQTLQTELAKHAQRTQQQPVSSPSTSAPAAGTPAPQNNRHDPAAKGNSHEGLHPPSALDRAIPASAAKLVETPPHEGIHAWLSERLMAIQQERQSRWQKIVQFLSGK